MNHKKLNLQESILYEFSNFLSDNFALYFPKEKYQDLERGILKVLTVLQEDDPITCLQNLKKKPLSKSEIELLTSQFTVGETYFFREPAYFDMLKTHILPSLIASRRDNNRMLRIWSAGCSSGEEPYSLAILVSELIPDLNDWNITILATDINLAAIKKLKEGIYSEWSFRNVSNDVKEKYFKKTKNNQYEILPVFKNMVSTNYLNLAENCYPSLINNTNAMDIIFCRNLLMYFVPSLVSEVLSRFKKSLHEAGYLIVGSSEHSLVPFNEFSERKTHQVILYQKGGSLSTPFILDGNSLQDEQMETQVDDMKTQVERVQTPVEDRTDTHIVSNTPLKLIQDKNISRSKIKNKIQNAGMKTKDSTRALEKKIGSSISKNVESDAMNDLDVKEENVENLARTLANQGKLQEALIALDNGIQNNKCNPALHYLKALVLQELNLIDEAAIELNKTIYLDHQFVLAYFSLGNLASNRKENAMAKKYYSIVLSLTQDFPPNEELTGSEGTMTVERIREIIHSKKLLH